MINDNQSSVSIQAPLLTSSIYIKQIVVAIDHCLAIVHLDLLHCDLTSDRFDGIYMILPS